MANTKNNTTPEVAFLCDKEQCENGHCDVCHHTFNIEHAINFKKVGDYYEEIDLEERTEDYKTIIRSVSMPNWLYKKATENGLSLSAVLQKALMETLSLKNKDTQ